MRVCIESYGNPKPWQNQEVLLRKLATGSASVEHSLVNTVVDADLILAVVQCDLRSVFVRFDHRRVFFCQSDLGIPLFPGIYPSLRLRYSRSRLAVSSAYLPKPWPFEVYHGRSASNSLYSFRGSVKTHPVREVVLGLRDSRADLVDTSASEGYRSGQPREVYERFHREYIESLASSKFVLCPRGVGASSIRLFEAMRAGRVPVVISDEWVPPKGIDWKKCCLRVAEADVRSLPRMLRAFEPCAEDMGREARRVWEQHFSEEMFFSTLVEEATRILQHSTFLKSLGVRLSLSLWNMRSVGVSRFRHRIRALFGSR